ncbi:MAG: ATP-binding cassette domain-containing protein [Acidobacteriota bacterium]
MQTSSTSTRSAAIRCQGLSRRFGSVRAVDGLDLDVPAHGVYGFLGPNGAGKTTTIRMLLGLIRPDAGRIELFGEPFGGTSSGRALARVGALVETPSIYGHLSGRDNLEVTRRLLGVARRHIDRVLDFVGLSDAADRLAKGYSLGMRQRLGVALALLAEPELLILDEPTNGLDPAGIREMRELIVSLPCDHGVTVFLSSHLLSEIEQMADHLGIVQDGRLCFEGPMSALHEKRQGYLELGLDRPEEARSVLDEAGWAVRPSDDGRLHATLPAVVDTADSAGVGIGALNALLVRRGFDVHHLSLQRPSLESLFLQMTAEGGA